MIFAIDFDGTCVTHEYPRIGNEIGAPRVLRRLVDAGHDIILFTMRSGEPLAEAQAWFCKHEIPLFGVNENPSQRTWTQSPKPYAHVYIDDAALGVPLVHPEAAHPLARRPYVDWAEVEDMLAQLGVFKTL